MNESFYNGISGMKTHQFGIDVWAKNITGINTTGFKTSIPEFSNIFNKQLISSFSEPISSDKGLGSTSQTTSTSFKQGSIVSTKGKYDLAINRDGWFGVTDQNGEKFYTRAGNFLKDRDGYLVDNGGNYVTGTSANNFLDNKAIKETKDTIKLNKAENQEKIHLPDNLIFPPTPTTKVGFSGSLNPEIKTEFNAQTGKNEEIPNIEVYRTNIIDANGDENLLEVIFTKEVPQKKDSTTWSAKATLLDNNKNPISTNNGQIKFNSRGALISNTLNSIDNNGTKTSLNFGTLYDPNKPNSGFDGIVSLAGFISERVTTKDGQKSGNLIDYSISDDGTIVANFDNSEAIPISKIAIYSFQNNQGLEQSNPIYFKETANSGKAKFFTDKDGNFINSTTISSGKLEMSNVNLSSALTELLIMQKAFDASSKSITTSDQLIQNAINMKK